MYAPFLENALGHETIGPFFSGLPKRDLFPVHRNAGSCVTRLLLGMGFRSIDAKVALAVTF